MEEKASQLRGMSAITYCCRCCKGIIIGGGHPFHLMSLLAGSDENHLDGVEERTVEIMKKPDPRYAMKNKR
ncbi:MAG: hypothetical protein IJ252_04140 [Solobacterium sp.]|nr:hypothetical protein [Solobacterium sp.]